VQIVRIWVKQWVGGWCSTSTYTQWGEFYLDISLCPRINQHWFEIRCRSNHLFVINQKILLQTITIYWVFTLPHYNCYSIFSITDLFVEALLYHLLNNKRLLGFLFLHRILFNFSGVTMVLCPCLQCINKQKKNEN
jgi:hypothetical protein